MSVFFVRKLMTIVILLCGLTAAGRVTYQQIYPDYSFACEEEIPEKLLGAGEGQVYQLLGEPTECAGDTLTYKNVRCKSGFLCPVSLRTRDGVVVEIQFRRGEW